MRNLVLIGMPASGKSTIGVLLAKTLGMDFVDTDLLLQRSQNLLLQDIIQKEGIKRFIQIEEETVTKLNYANCVISTGGSVVYSEKAMEHLKKEGVIIYLDVSFEEIQRRLINIKTRGVVMDKGQDLYSLFAERTPLYHKYADIVENCSGKEVETIVSEIAEMVKVYKYK